MVASAFHLSLELRACDNRFLSKGSVFAFPCAFTKQFLGRRDPKGFSFGQPIESYHRGRDGFWYVRAGYGEESNFPATWVVQRGGEESVIANDLPFRFNFAGPICTRNWAYLVNAANEGVMELWRLDIETLKWQCVKLMKGNIEDFRGFGVVEMEPEKWRVVGIDDAPSRLAVWDEQPFPRTLDCYDVFGLLAHVMFVTQDVVMLLTFKGGRQDVGELVLYYIGSDKSHRALWKEWWITDEEQTLLPGNPPHYPRGDIVPLDENLLNHGVDELLLEF
ncbi:hypothetical protein FOL47_007347 [Perkinsus chesapeaki]|uniref:Uncharacterized protein n=1 Tax=Perkinsus chesapeaki TaxID=330153 RepID=A0A7J6MWD8_PERCH|nr:hypothetical protein FOL47_007347 [Perkinsus chesapeaki]